MVKNVSLLIVAAVLSVAWATPCTDVCFGTCDVGSDGTSIFLPFFGAFVEPNRDACRAVCAATCNCVDTCQTACGTQLATCRAEPNTGFYHLVKCQFDLTICGAVCGTHCGMETTASIMKRAIEIVLPSEGLQPEN